MVYLDFMDRSCTYLFDGCEAGLPDALEFDEAEKVAGMLRDQNGVDQLRCGAIVTCIEKAPQLNRLLRNHTRQSTKVSFTWVTSVMSLKSVMRRLNLFAIFFLSFLF
jgi:hypothetical protein